MLPPDCLTKYEYWTKESYFVKRIVLTFLERERSRCDMHDEQPWNAARRNMPETKRNIQDYHRKLVYIISKQKISEITIRRFASSSFFLSISWCNPEIKPFSHYSSLQHVSQLASSSPTYRLGKGSLCKTRSEATVSVVDARKRLCIHRTRKGGKASPAIHRRRRDVLSRKA